MVEEEEEALLEDFIDPDLAEADGELLFEEDGGELLYENGEPSVEEEGEEQFFDEGVDEEAPFDDIEPPLEDGDAAEVPTDDDAEEDRSEEEDDGSEPEVQETIMDAVEASLRLKRLLSRDDEGTASGPAQKKRKVNGRDEQRPIVRAKVKQLLQKWNLSQDSVAKHVLDNLSVEELEYLRNSNFMPEKFNARKTPAELLAQHMLGMKEKKVAGGSRLDVVSAFRIRWQLDAESDKRLRELTHKELRYVMQEYDGSLPIEDVITEASAEIPREDNGTASAMPGGPGMKTMGRFNRLELIDPLADCAVFGDANLTFSINLAKHRKDLGHVGRVIATTFEEIDVLRERYKEIDQNIQTLKDNFAEVYHGVDCTRIAIDPRFEGVEGKLGAVYYNFPHSGAIQGFFDSHPLVNWRHENLMRLFFRALRSFVKPGGLVKVSSNSGAVGVRYSYIVSSALENEFLHVETMPFLEWHLHRYGRSYGDRRDVYKRPDAVKNQSYSSQNAQADMVYCFCYAPTGNVLPKQQIRLPPTHKTLAECRDGPFCHLQGAARTNLAKQMHERFVREVSGHHVG